MPKALTSWARGALLLLATPLLAGCIRHYRWPEPNEPHALLKLRRVLHDSPGERREITVDIGEDRERLWSSDEHSAGAFRATDLSRIRPGNNQIVFATKFSHQEMTMVEEIYEVPYTVTDYREETLAESRPCRAGESSPCTVTITRRRPVHRTYTEQRTRLVQRWDTVIDDACSAAVGAYFGQGGVYLLQYTYLGYGNCSLTCLQQFSAPQNERAVFQPCPPPMPALPKRASAAHPG